MALVTDLVGGSRTPILGGTAHHQHCHCNSHSGGGGSGGGQYCNFDGDGGVLRVPTPSSEL